MPSKAVQPKIRAQERRKPAACPASLASWSIETWPASVWPGAAGRARHLVRVHKDDLLRAGALVRVGRELVILGDRYGKWLQRRAADVATYECNANRERKTA